MHPDHYTILVASWLTFGNVTPDRLRVCEGTYDQLTFPPIEDGHQAWFTPARSWGGLHVN
jgi:hypothetical protein